MKKRFRDLFFVCVGAVIWHFGSGFFAELRTGADSSLAGQTLRDVSMAIRQVKSETGQWPDSIADLEVKSSSAEFSAEVFDRIQYSKTESGFVIFVGVPNGAYCDESGQVMYR